MLGPPKGFSAVRKALERTGYWASDRKDSVSSTDLAHLMEKASASSFSFIFMIALSACIATLGLIANSAPAIIGAMIIAPLMSPIVGLSYGLTAFEKRLVIKSFLTLTAGVILVVVLAYIITVLFGLRITGSEILSRTSPTLIDLGIAMAAGAAAALANSRRSILNSIAGVAIAVALVPPLAVCGIGLALGGKATAEAGLSLTEFGLYSGGRDIALGAFVLFLTNLFGIVAVAIIVFACQRFGDWKKSLIALLLVVGCLALLIQPLGRALNQLYAKHRVVRLINKLALDRPDIISGKGKVQSINVSYRDGILHVNIDSFVPKERLVETPGTPNAQKRLELFREFLSTDIGEPVVVEHDIVAVEMLHLKAEPPEGQNAE